MFFWGRCSVLCRISCMKLHTKVFAYASFSDRTTASFSLISYSSDWLLYLCLHMLHTYVHTYINTYTHACIHTYIHVRTYIHTYIHTYITYLIDFRIILDGKSAKRGTGLDRPWGFQEFGAPRFHDSHHMKVVMLSALCTSSLCVFASSYSQVVCSFSTESSEKCFLLWQEIYFKRTRVTFLWQVVKFSCTIYYSWET